MAEELPSYVQYYGLERELKLKWKKMSQDFDYQLINYLGNKSKSPLMNTIPQPNDGRSYPFQPINI